MLLRPLPLALFAAVSLLLVGGALTLWLVANGDGPAPAFAATRANAAPQAPTAAAGTGEAANAPNAELAGAGVERTGAGEQPANARPFPPDAAWLTITIVDQETQQPAPGATVRWFDESAWPFLEEQGTLATEGSTLLWWDKERIADLAGWRTSADADGRARVTLTSTITVLAELDERFGMLSLQPNTLAPADGHRLELAPERSVQLQVLDAQGHGCAGVPVAIVLLDTVGEPFHQVAMAKTVAPHGLATLRHLQVCASAERVAAAAATGMRADVLVVGYDAPAVPIDLGALPTAPIVFRLPPCGSVRVRGEFAGRALPDFEHATVSLYVNDEPGPWDTHVERDGWAHFPWVPLGLTLSAWADVFGGAYCEFEGPRIAGQQVDAVMSPPADLIALKGRMLDRDRTPIANAQVSVRAAGPEFDASGHTRTDANGRFEVCLGEPGDDARVDDLRFDCSRKGQATLRAVAAPRTLRSGVEDLGDLMPADLPLIVGGRVQGADAAAIAALTLHVERQQNDDGQGDPRWQRLEHALLHKDAAGAFTVRGATAPGPHRIALESADVLPVAPIEFTLGTADVVITIDRGMPLAASVLLPAGAPAELLCAALVPVAAAPLSAELRERLETRPDDDDARHDLRWQTVPHGTYTLELRPWAAPAPVLRIPDVQVPQPGGGDPRLRDIDLRALVRPLLLSISDTHSADDPFCRGAVFFADAVADATRQGMQVYGSETQLLVPARAVDLIVCVEGCRPLPCRSTGERLDVRVDYWPTVRVELQGMPSLPADLTVYASLSATAAPAGRYQVQRNVDGGSLDQLFAPPTHSLPMHDGAVRLPIGDGEHRLQLFLERERLEWHELRVRHPTTVLPSSDHVIASVDAAEWQRAIDALKPRR